MRKHELRVNIYAQGMGIRIPDDVPIIGFDSVRLLGDMDFPCSMIVQPLKGIAKACVNLMLDEHIKEDPPSYVCPSVMLTAE